MQKVGVVIPCFNETGRINAAAFSNFLRANEFIDLCFVNDGSKDDTLTVLKDLQSINKERIFVIDLPRNVGKAEAVRTGILSMIDRSQYEFVGYFDADLSAPLSELDYFFFMKKLRPNCKVMLGSRVKRLGTNIERKAYRHYLGRVFSTIASMILRLPVYDTQCGAKLFDGVLAKEIFEAPFISSWLFDIELLARVNEKTGSAEANNIILEIPLNEWVHKGDSKMRISDLLKVPSDLIKIFWHYRNKY